MDLEIVKKEILNGDAQLLDVRELHEWNDGHLQHALFIPLSELKEGKIAESLNRNLKTYLHCRSGVRVHTAAPILQQMGFKEIIPLSAGYEALVSHQFEKAQ